MDSVSVSVFRAAEWETRGRLSIGIASEALRGVQNIMTMKWAGEWNVVPPNPKGVDRMLSLALTPGEYLTIGDNVVVQLHTITGDRCKVTVTAPREIPILRGEVLERDGGRRPDCVFDGPRRHRSEISWNRSKAQTLAAMRTLLSQMDGRDSNVQTLRRQLNHMFPPGEAEQPSKVSPG